MDFFVIGSILFGIVLARYFTVYVLFPACALAIVLILASPMHAPHGAWGLAFEIGASIAGIQFGYVAGLLLQAMPTTLQRFRGDSTYVSSTPAPSSMGAGGLGHRRIRKASGGKPTRKTSGARSEGKPQKIEPAA